MRKEYHPQWYALYTRARHEKFVESQLLYKGVEAFTPKIALRKKWSDRIKIIQEPLFKSYCFARFSLDDKAKVVSQVGVVKMIHFKCQYVPVPESVVNSLKIIQANKIQTNPYPYINVGDRVVIKKGPLKGVEGFIIEKRNKNTSLVISVDAICASVKCDMGSIDLA